MGWVILLFILLRSRASSPAASAPAGAGVFRPINYIPIGGRYGNGVVPMTEIESHTPNILFQTGRDPGEAGQPPTWVVTSDSAFNDPTATENALLATLPGSKPKFAAVSLGPTVGQQSQQLLNDFSQGGRFWDLGSIVSSTPEPGGTGLNTGAYIDPAETFK